MNVDVMVNGRPLKVAIEPAGGPGELTVTIEGKTRVVDASWVDADTLSLVDAGVVREIRFHPREEAGAVGVEIDGTSYEAIVSNGRAGRTGAKGAMGAVGTSPPTDATSVKAPMPGRIVRVLVGVGDRVAARQPVVVVEAMKMENELRSPRDGVVTEVLVAPGVAVESSAVLIVVGP